LRGRGGTMTNLARNASFHTNESITPSNLGIKHNLLWLHISHSDKICIDVNLVHLVISVNLMQIAGRSNSMDPHAIVRKKIIEIFKTSFCVKACPTEFERAKVNFSSFKKILSAT
jgi:hypothetical protein